MSLSDCIICVGDVMQYRYFAIRDLVSLKLVCKSYLSSLIGLKPQLANNRAVFIAAHNNDFSVVRHIAKIDKPYYSEQAAGLLTMNCKYSNIKEYLDKVPMNDFYPVVYVGVKMRKSAVVNILFNNGVVLTNKMDALMHKHGFKLNNNNLKFTKLTYIRNIILEMYPDISFGEFCRIEDMVLCGWKASLSVSATNTIKIAGFIRAIKEQVIS